LDSLLLLVSHSRRPHLRKTFTSAGVGSALTLIPVITMTAIGGVTAIAPKGSSGVVLSAAALRSFGGMTDLCGESVAAETSRLAHLCN
jgi:hypothetical protein